MAGKRTAPSSRAGARDEESGPARHRRLYLAALRLLSRRALTEQQIVTRLGRYDATPPEASAVVAGLRRVGYLDDLATAAQWLRSWRARKGWGPIRIEQELVRRGVARPMIRQLLDGAWGPDDEDSEAMAVAARLSGRPSFQRADGMRAARRLTGQLARRGFSGPTIRRVVARCCRASIAER